MKEKGITLIALIITIIILIILAAVTLKAVFLDDMIGFATNGVGNYVTAQEDELDEFENADNYINKATNKKPVFKNIEVTGMTATSATIKVRAIDGDGEKLTYKLFYGTDKDNLIEKDKRENVDQDTDVEFQISGIDTTIIYYYRIDVLDQYVTVQSQVSILTNKKPEIEKAEVTDITRTSIIAKVQGTDGDIDDRLTYKIYLGTDKNTLETDGKTVQKENITSGKEETLNVDGLTPGTKYFYKIAVTDGKQTVYKEGEFTTVANNTPTITPEIARDITVESNPLNSTSWIQLSAKVEDTDNDKLDIKIYLGTASADKLGETDLIESQSNAVSRDNSNTEKRQFNNGNNI